MLNKVGLSNIKNSLNNYSDSFDNTDAKNKRVHFYFNHVKLTSYLDYILDKDADIIISHLKHRLQKVWNFPNYVLYGKDRINTMANKYENQINLLISFINYLTSSDWIDFTPKYNVDDIYGFTIYMIKYAIQENENTLRSYDDLDDAVNYKDNIKQNKRLLKIFHKAIYNYKINGNIGLSWSKQKQIDRDIKQKTYLN